jgi:ferredoxin-NADP reductase
VAAARVLSPDVLEVDLDLIEPAEVAFEAGQWVSVPFGPKTVRAYSIASTPRSSSRITLSADLAPGGVGSAWFRGLSAGQAVQFKAPFGGFVFRRDDPRRPLFVAEEIGIVPIRAMLADLDETGFALRGALLYGGRDPDALAYDAELRALARRHAEFAYHRVPMRGAADMTAAVGSHAWEASDLVAYVCGGGALIDAVRGALVARGLDRRSVRWEKFW